MFAHVSVKKDRFEALLWFLISDAIQPFKNPLVIGHTPNFFEARRSTVSPFRPRRTSASSSSASRGRTTPS